MPNWCYTSYWFKGKSKDVKSFHDNLVEWTSKPNVDNGFGNSWLGNVLAGAGLHNRLDICPNVPKAKIIRCRGQILEDIGDVTEADDNTSEFWLSTETAWQAIPEVFDAIINKFKYDIEYGFQEEEPGNEVYNIYCPSDMNYFEYEDVCIDKFIHNPSKLLEDYPCLEELVDIAYCSQSWFDKWLKDHGFNSPDDINNLDFDESDGEYFSVHYFEYINRWW